MTKKGKIRKIQTTEQGLTRKQTAKLEKEIVKCEVKHSGDPGAVNECIEEAVDKVTGG